MRKGTKENTSGWSDRRCYSTMFRPIHIVWNQSILGNRDIENLVLEKQCSQGSE